MRICRFTTSETITPRLGLLEGEFVRPLSEGETFESFPKPQTDEAVPLSEVQLLVPVAPSKIVCVGRNYREHAAELGNKMPDEPLLFLKAPSALIANGDCIELPPQSKQVEHEGELGVVIGRRATRFTDNDDPLSYVSGYTCVNDVTARDLQRKDVQFTRAKSFDTFCPVGPFIVAGLDPLNLEVTTRVNGSVKQNGNTADMAFSVPFLIRYISNIMTLYPGDLIATGTPAGVSPIKDGDVVEVEIEGIGVLRNSVCDAKSMVRQ
ncbi:MAG TPA: fumarylacetoacetate hydrolase family protein [Pyrinomonadaceae bacterium]|jgi:2-keto-4-pentenoate hydratase/2-oxohepta-3-ene-1,7-dioic acid hydratase in catechol pathway|nr:fumarylacetoacetate hydrolase family protein [Pyrinomonadaceae bacterium]